MWKHWKWALVATVTVALVVAAPGLAAKGGKGGGGKQSAPYRLVDLGYRCYPCAISNANESGEFYVAGTYRLGNAPGHAVLWKIDAQGNVLWREDILPFEGGDYANAEGVNNLGDVVGYAGHAFLKRPGQQILDLNAYFEDPPEVVTSHAYDINDGGQIVGTAAYVIRDEQGKWLRAETHGVYWEIAAVEAGVPPVDLGDFFPRSINEYGIMAGEKEGTAAIGFFDQNGELVVIPLGALPAYDRSIALCINIYGDVVGYSKDSATVERRACLWSPSGNITDLGDLGKRYRSSEALGVNDVRSVVGYELDTGTNSAWVHRAFIWEGGVMTDLNGMIEATTEEGEWELSCAYAINNSGHIVGQSYVWRTSRYFVHHGFLLLPKP